jgi:nucleoid-associated protein YgaU
MIADISRPHRSHRRRDWGLERRLVLALVVALALVVYLANAVYSGISGGGPDTVVVHHGDTVWSIAAGHADGADVRQLVDRIIAANHLPAGGALVPGQSLVIPTS